MRAFEGDLHQNPPPYCATKVGGVKFYELARRGEEVPEKTKTVTSGASSPPASSTGDELAFRLACSSGTYARSLAHELGRRLGTAPPGAAAAPADRRLQRRAGGAGRRSRGRVRPRPGVDLVHPVRRHPAARSRRSAPTPSRSAASPTARPSWSGTPGRRGRLGQGGQRPPRVRGRRARWSRASARTASRVVQPKIVFK